jgi:flavin reductase (DIM6/NTAB) family NADH-FMN oxidoreductase RutF
VHGAENPFATPPELRDPARRLRGRLAAPVTVWTAGVGERRAGLTISSLLVAEGEPASVVGLVNPTSDLWDALHETKAFVVHVLGQGDRRLAQRFAGTWPSPGGLFAGEPIEDSPWGPKLPLAGTRACCRFAESTEAGYQQLVRGTIESIELGPETSPLVYWQGRFQRLE